LTENAEMHRLRVRALRPKVKRRLTKCA
jgi:hypothetical protein